MGPRKHVALKQTGYYQEKRGLEFPSTEQISKRIKTARNAAFFSLYEGIYIENPQDRDHEDDFNPLAKLQPEMIKARRKNSGIGICSEI